MSETLWFLLVVWCLGSVLFASFLAAEAMHSPGDGLRWWVWPVLGPVAPFVAGVMAISWLADRAFGARR